MKGSFTTRIFGFAAAAVIAAGFAYAAPADSQSIAGRWDATLTTKTGVVPFRLDISGEGRPFGWRDYTPYALIKRRRARQNFR